MKPMTLTGMRHLRERSLAASSSLRPQIRMSCTGRPAASRRSVMSIHHFGAVAAEQDDRGGEVWLEAEFGAEGDRIGIVGDVEVGAQDHAGGGEDVGVVVTEGAGLIDGALGTGDDVLVLDGLDPEVRGEVGKSVMRVTKGRPGQTSVPAFVDLAIEVGDDRNQQVGGLFAPAVFQEADQRTVEDPNGGLEDAEEVDGAQGPAVLEERVVLLLDADAGEPAEDVELVGKLLELDEFDLPGALLLREDRLQGDSGVAVTATGVMKKDVDFFHVGIVTSALSFASKSTLTCHVDNDGSHLCSMSSMSTFMQISPTSSRTVHIDPSTIVSCDATFTFTRQRRECATLPGSSRVCRESYNDPQEVYDRLKRLGMSIVTMTDHDSIDAAEVAAASPGLLPERRSDGANAQRHRDAPRRLRHHRARPCRNPDDGGTISSRW